MKTRSGAGKSRYLLFRFDDRHAGAKHLYFYQNIWHMIDDKHGHVALNECDSKRLCVLFVSAFSLSTSFFKTDTTTQWINPYFLQVSFFSGILYSSLRQISWYIIRWLSCIVSINTGWPILCYLDIVGIVSWFILYCELLCVSQPW